MDATPTIQHVIWPRPIASNATPYSSVASLEPAKTKPPAGAPKVAGLHRDPPVFPPLHLLDNLNPEDASSKIFCAIGRTLLSVDNRAMTIKDLAEKIVQQESGTCQNASAAGQAITTFIRSHTTRCANNNDEPLLLRHVMSGTPSDDDLVPGLYSTTGGAQSSTPSDSRYTYFRRGTMVWYLSPEVDAACPFARAGIRLSEYGEGGRAGTEGAQKEQKRLRDRQRKEQQCGQKRKRLVRGCAAKDSDTESGRPAKVMFTLRLKPTAVGRTATREVVDLSHETDSESDLDSSDDESDSMSVDSEDSESDSDLELASPPPAALPPYPKCSISIPYYSPQASLSPSCSSQDMTSLRHRSPSVPYSIASPPPNSVDSEDEMDDFHVSMVNSRRFSETAGSYDAGGDWDDMDSSGELDSPGPSSPAAGPFYYPEITVKEEPDIVGQTLDEFENVYESGAVKVKIESVDVWEFVSTASNGWLDEREIKQEELDFTENLFSPTEPLAIPIPPVDSLFSPLSSVSSSNSSSFEDHEDSMVDLWRSTSSMSVQDGDWNASLKRARNRAQTAPSLTQSGNNDYTLIPTTQSDSTIHPSMSYSISPNSEAFDPPARWIGPQAVLETHRGSNSPVVRTLVPCTPEITALEMDGIAVYQVQIGTTSVFRRIDTDFVHLTPIIKLVDLQTHPLANAIIVSGFKEVAGAWTPLASAREFIAEHPLQNGVLDVFLSPNLFQLFSPGSMVSSAHGNPVTFFGPHFRSTLLQQPLAAASVLAWDVPRWEEEIKTSKQADLSVMYHEDDTPLSPLEQEMFSAFCILPDQDKESTSTPAPDTVDAPMDPQAPNRPLRRSKRVAKATTRVK